MEMILLIILALSCMMITNSIKVNPTTNDPFINIELSNDPRQLNEITTNNEWNLQQHEYNPIYNWYVFFSQDIYMTSIYNNH